MTGTSQRARSVPSRPSQRRAPLALLLLLALLMTACSDLAPRITPSPGLTVAASRATPPDVAALLHQAFRNLRAGATLRMELQHSGEPFLIATDFGDVVFRSARAGFVAPNTWQAVAQVSILGLPADVDLFIRGGQQWYRNALLTGGRWQAGTILQNFDPQQLFAAGSGFDRAAEALSGLQWQGLVALGDGHVAHLLRGPARGEDLSALLLNLVALSGALQTELTIDRDSLLPRRFVLQQPGLAIWDLRLSQVNAPLQLDVPPQADA